MSKEKKQLSTEEHKAEMRQQLIDRKKGRSKKEIITLIVSVIIALYAGFYGGIAYQRHVDAHAIAASKSSK